MIETIFDTILIVGIPVLIGWGILTILRGL